MNNKMTRLKKGGKVTKGMPSAVLLSIAVHAALFFLAGALVVFTVVKKTEKKFEPPKAVERPKMKLKKPKVKVRKTSKPKPTQRIVTKMNRASMPDIQLPEMSGMGEGFVGGIGGFDMMPDLGDPTLFGTTHSIGNDFTGTFYDFKRDRSGRPISVDLTGEEWRGIIYKFLRSDWKASSIARYFRSPRKLYSTFFVVPVTLSSIAPVSFGDKDAVGALWAVHYEGKLVCPASHTNGITFRFWGMADEFLAVRVDNKPVLYLDWWRGDIQKKIVGNIWNSDSADSRKYFMGNGPAEVGDWITLEPGESMNMEILFGDNGGAASCFLAVEEKGVEYERNRQGGPLLPAFKTAVLSHEQLDLIYNLQREGEICMTNGPVFCDYDVSRKAQAGQEPEITDPPAAEELDRDALRTWRLADGRFIEAEFVNIFGEKVVLKNVNGKICKIQKEQFSPEDIEYVELACPPVLDVNFLNSIRQHRFSGGFHDVEFWARPPEQRGHYGLQIKQTSPGEYNHELQGEMFVVGKQIGKGKYLLLDHQEFKFNPAEEEQRLFEFRSEKKVVMAHYSDWYKSEIFGEEYSSYLVVVSDAKGEIVTVKSPKKWLIENVENLRKLSVGNYFDETCTRTYPDRPGKSRFY